MTKINDYVDPFVGVEDKLESVKDWVMQVPMSSSTIKELETLIANYSEEVRKTKDAADAKDAIKDFTDKLRSTYTGHWLRGEYTNVLNREKLVLSQSVDSESGPIRIQGQTVSANKAISGTSALIALQNLMGVGRPTRVPLWHSGIVLTLANFKENEMLSLNHSLNEQRMELGYATQAFLFSGGDVNLVMEIVDFVLEHVISTNIKGWIQGDIGMLKELILVSDVQALMSGALDAIYPSGYPTERHCINSGTDKCDYKPKLKKTVTGIEFDVDSLLRFNRTLWIDTDRLPLEAVQHMSMPSASHDKTAIVKYQKLVNIVNNLSDPVVINGASIKIALQQPTLATYEHGGTLWIAGVKDMVNKAMAGVEDTDKKTRANKRRRFIQDYEYVLRFQKHAAWVKSIQYGRVGDEEEVGLVEDPKTIFSIMGELAQNEDIVVAANAAINKYREDTQLSFTGIPNYSCPSCGAAQVTGEDAKHSLIPMNMVQYFFTIMAWRLGRIAQAQMEI